MGYIAVAHMEPQGSPEVMMVGSCIPPPPLESSPSQIASTTFMSEGVCLGPQQLKKLKGLIVQQDEQGTKASVDEDWCNLLDHT